MSSNVFLDLTGEFNAGRLRAVISSGQAVVLHRLAVMSKDGDWLLLEDEEALAHVIAVLSSKGARYRFGAPLDVRWMRGGWSAHLEHRSGTFRVRTDFVTRPPRIAPDRLARIWQEAEAMDPPVIGLRDLAEIKKTNREKDYPIIGELARAMADVEDQLLFSRSARDLLEICRRYPDRARSLASRRPLLGAAERGREALELSLDAERRALMKTNEVRLLRYVHAAEAWRAAWPALEREVATLPLSEAHEAIVRRAVDLLPFALAGGPIDG